MKKKPHGNMPCGFFVVYTSLSVRCAGFNLHQRLAVFHDGFLRTRAAAGGLPRRFCFWRWRDSALDRVGLDQDQAAGAERFCYVGCFWFTRSGLLSAGFYCYRRYWCGWNSLLWLRFRSSWAFHGYRRHFGRCCSLAGWL